MEYPRKDLTIAAIATPIGTGGLGIVRISGSAAFGIAEKVFRPARGEISRFKSHTVHLGVVHQNGSDIDSALMTLMQAPRSYTGEDTVEFSCHGGRVILARVLTAVIESGAVPAEPGEFSMRAFLNGKLDLAQAEAVQELICAENELALEVARRKLEGRLSGEINNIRRQLIEAAAEVEATIDFVEEDIDPADSKDLLDRLAQTLDSINGLIQSYADGRRISAGTNIVIAGKPNVGKSSLLNALADRDRAIVTEIPGTTRDVIREPLLYKGISINIIDTAGIRNPGNRIEQAGIEKTAAEIGQADLVAFVVDRSCPVEKPDLDIFKSIQSEKCIMVLNKIDLEAAIDDVDLKKNFGLLPEARVSALRGTNIEQLKTLLYNRARATELPGPGQSVITSARHLQALENTARSIRQAMCGLDHNQSPEFTAIELRSALESLGAITGHNVTEEILESVFSKFCIGK